MGRVERFVMLHDEYPIWGKPKRQENQSDEGATVLLPACLHL